MFIWGTVCLASDNVPPIVASTAYLSILCLLFSSHWKVQANKSKVLPKFKRVSFQSHFKMHVGKDPIYKSDYILSFTVPIHVYNNVDNKEKQWNTSSETKFKKQF